MLHNSPTQKAVYTGLDMKHRSTSHGQLCAQGVANKSPRRALSSSSAAVRELKGDPALFVASVKRLVQQRNSEQNTCEPPKEPIAFLTFKACRNPLLSCQQGLHLPAPAGILRLSPWHTCLPQIAHPKPASGLKPVDTFMIHRTDGRFGDLNNV